MVWGLKQSPGSCHLLNHRRNLDLPIHYNCRHQLHYQLPFAKVIFHQEKVRINRHMSVPHRLSFLIQLCLSLQRDLCFHFHLCQEVHQKTCYKALLPATVVPQVFPRRRRRKGF